MQVQLNKLNNNEMNNQQSSKGQIINISSKKAFQKMKEQSVHEETYSKRPITRVNLQRLHISHMLPTNSNESNQQANQQNQQQTGLMQQFKQQIMKAWQPVPTLNKTIVSFLILGLCFLAIGIPMMILSNDLSQSYIRYDNLQNTTCPLNSTCNVTIQVNTKLTAPIFVYYQLRNFFQNHRLFASSYSYQQLTGTTISESTANQVCTPIVYNRDLYVTTSPFTNTTLNPNEIANPCGIIAYTVFNDTYNLYTQGNASTFNILDYGIAWPSDIQLYKVVNPAGMWYNTSSQRFMNWMRIAAMPNFRKLWGRIENDIPAGNYTVQIQNLYDVSGIQGQKYFVLSTSNFFGSKSNFLAISYIAVGSVCILIAFLFIMRKLSKKSKNM